MRINNSTTFLKPQKRNKIKIKRKVDVEFISKFYCNKLLDSGTKCS